jgi:hypothetical protein
METGALAEETPMIPELRDGLLDAGTGYLVDRGLPDATEVWADGVVDATVEEIIPVVASMLEAAIARHLAEPVSGC